MFMMFHAPKKHLPWLVGIFALTLLAGAILPLVA